MQRFILIVVCVLVAFCQDPNQPSERIDQAHRPLLQPQVSKAKIAAESTALVDAARPKSHEVAREIRRQTFVDEHIFGRMERDAIPHAGLSTDEEFVRRAYLDATGRIPPMTELLEFLASDDPQKRDKLIDRLVESDAFVDRWAFYFEDLFRAGGKMAFGLNLFNYWIREWLTLDRPYSEVVTELLTGVGKTSSSTPGALYFARDYVRDKDDPAAPDAQDLVNIGDTIDDFTVTYGKVLLGLNLACISCHDGKAHLEKVNLFAVEKTREQFFQQASFMGRTRLIMNWENGFMVNTEFAVDDLGSGYDTKAVGGMRVPRTGGSNQPRFILTGESPRPGHNVRAELARMLTTHIQFSRAFTNRIWAEFMGFGIVEPVDNFDLARYDPEKPLPAPWTIQPSNPKLLDALAKDFVDHGYSFKHLVKTLMKSSAYQLSSRFMGEWKEQYVSYYARKYVRVLSAAELHDAISLATARPGSPSGGSDKPSMVMQMSNPNRVPKDVGAFLMVFGQGDREQLPTKTTPSALQAMLLMQSKLVTDRVLAKGGTRVQHLLELSAEDRLLVEQVYRTTLSRPATETELSTAVDRALVDRLYLSTLSRHPEDKEMTIGLRALGPDRTRGAEDLQWALINSPEFLFNY